MPDNLAYIAAAYAVVLGSALSYGLWLRLRVTRSRRALGTSRQAGGEGSS